MKKYIDVLIKNNKKTIQKVSKGYAFNYLIPNNIAEIATKGKIKHIQMLNDLSNKKRSQINQQILKTNDNILNTRIIHLRKKCGQNQQIFGSVSEQEIKEYILNTTGEKIEKKQIFIETIKKIGSSICYIMINDDIKTPIKIRILPGRI